MRRSIIIPHIFIRLSRNLSEFKILKNGLERETSDRISCRECPRALIPNEKGMPLTSVSRHDL